VVDKEIIEIVRGVYAVRWEDLLQKLESVRKSYPIATEQNPVLDAYSVICNCLLTRKTLTRIYHTTAYYCSAAVWEGQQKLTTREKKDIRRTVRYFRKKLRIIGQAMVELGEW
jgi:hypothetical protein